MPDAIGWRGAVAPGTRSIAHNAGAGAWLTAGSAIGPDGQTGGGGGPCPLAWDTARVSQAAGGSGKPWKGG